jgi:starch synthase
MTLRVLAVTSEVYPLVKTGGLADVAGALPAALAAEDVAVTTLIPGYPAVMAALDDAETVAAIGDARILAARAGGLSLFVLDSPSLFDRPGDPYRAADGAEWSDNPQRFAALARAGAAVARGAITGWQPDAVHAHDWQAGLLPAYLRFGTPGEERGAPSVMTIHNLAFQGQAPASLLAELGLPPAAYALDGIEYYGSIGFLKAGVQLADRVTTVSPGYAAEIRTAAGGMGMDGVLRARGGDFVGILNGIDTDVWDPSRDDRIAQTFDAARLAERAVNKTVLEARFRLPPSPETLLIGVVSRLSWQKGMDTLPAVIAALPAIGARMIVLGSGDAGLEAALRDAAAASDGRAAVIFGYDETLAHLIYAGADALLIPSRFEPCGLTQLCAMRYGCLPAVARVGGLADTVVDANVAALGAGVATGFQFPPGSAADIVAGLERVAAVWARPLAWQTMQRNALRTEVGWSQSAARYAALFREIARA